MVLRTKLLLTICIIFGLFSSCDKEVSVTPPEASPPEAEIILNTNPAGYSIFLNDKITGQNTPDSLIYLTSGEHQLGFEHPFYLDTTITVDLDSNETISLNIDVAEHPNFRGSLYLRSRPHRAEIILDDIRTGKYTPSTISGIYPGPHKIAFRKFGYRDYVEEVTLKSNELLAINESLVDTTVWLTYNTQNTNISTNYLTCFSSYGRWIGTADNGVFLRDESTFTHLGLQNNAIADVSSNEIGQPISVTISGDVFEYYDNKWNSLNKRIPEFNDYTKVNAVNLHYGVLYLCTKSAGLLAIENNSLSYLSNEFPDLPKEINCMTNNYRRNMIIGSRERGLFIKHNSSQEWINLNTSNSILGSNNITAVAIGYDGMFVTEIYIGVSTGLLSGKLYVLKNDNLTEIDIGYNKVYSIHARQARAWVGTPNGLYRIQNRVAINNYTTDNSPVPSNYVYDVYEMADEVWMATGNGLVRFDYQKDTGG